MVHARDLDVNAGTVTELRSFESGVARVDPWTDTGLVDTKYYHADMIGTTRHMTDSNGNEVEPAVYTAFGEKISGSAQRYGYAGAFGYQTHDDFPFLHVGHRYYDPATGRFLQRDPIGIDGGTNVYEYVRSLPTQLVDLFGLNAAACFYEIISRAHDAATATLGIPLAYAGAAIADAVTTVFGVPFYSDYKTGDITRAVHEEIQEFLEREREKHRVHPKNGGKSADGGRRIS